MRLDLLFSVLAFYPIVSFAQEGGRGSLDVSSDPDSASIYLDDSKAAESMGTPFSNNAMIPGKHKILLVAGDPSYKPAMYEVDIGDGQSVSLHHDFQFRTQAFDAKHLSVSPWNFRIGAGYTYKRYLGVLGGENYDPDSIPTSTSFPLDFHLGLPNGLEARLGFPIGWLTDSAGNSGNTSIGDVGVGLQYTHKPLRSAIALDWTLPRASRSAGGLNRHLLDISLVTSQTIGIAELFANLAYSMHFSDQDSSRLSYGDHIKAYVRPGLPVAGFLLPNLGIRGEYWFADSYGKENLANNGYLLSFEPGIIADLGQNANLELAIPIFLLGDKAYKGWGIHMGVSFGFGFADKSQGRGGAYGEGLDSKGQSQYQPVIFDSYEVTNAEFRKFCEINGRPLPPDPQFPGMPDYATNPAFDQYPAVNVSFEDAKAYARWKGKRLPTVEEWKNAVRSLDATAAPACGLSSPKPVRSGALQAGSFHMVGNVAEWVTGDDAVAGTAYFAGGFYSLPLERCLDTERLVDISSQSGSSIIGFRLVTEIR